ncbi:SMI1/KNR4 family protein [Streptomyces lunaelactis]|uniref:SMI1/KNR4 family protein n=1 Tax=Streptomyces lunaelactis TaxID=1535768 RepID=UPI001FE46505|nr:SMI1/KNR4 family protein [Streptomyces lunaelactis]
MNSRMTRLRRKLAQIPFQPRRSHSFGEEHHEFRLGPCLSEVQISAFEAEHGIDLPGPYRQFLTSLGASGASPFYGLIPLEGCGLFTMDPRETPEAPRGFTRAHHGERERELFLHIIEMGCTDLCLVAVTGPLTGRILTGNSDGFWGPNVSSANDFLDWYERWLDQMAAGRDNRALELTSPRVAATAPWGPRVTASRQAAGSGNDLAAAACDGSEAFDK